MVVVVIPSEPKVIQRNGDDDGSGNSVDDGSRTHGRVFGPGGTMMVVGSFGGPLGS